MIKWKGMKMEGDMRKWNGNVMEHVKEMRRWGEWKWKMEGNECAREEKTWDGTQRWRFKSHEMKLESLVRSG